MVAPGRSRRLMAGLGSIFAVTASACSSPAGHTQTGSGASCLPRTQSQYLAMARTVFEGYMLQGPAIDGSLASPAKLRVVRYLKGTGPQIVTVVTAATESGNNVLTSEDGIQPQAGQRWKIYTTTKSMPYQTSVCAGSSQENTSGKGLQG